MTPSPPHAHAKKHTSQAIKLKKQIENEEVFTDNSACRTDPELPL